MGFVKTQVRYKQTSLALAREYKAGSLVFV